MSGIRNGQQLRKALRDENDLMRSINRLEEEKL